MRTLLEIQVRGLKLRGTCHHPPVSAVDTRTGILFLNSGFLPRASQGDVTAHQADDLASAGYLAFRFDMPGLGDSEGELDENALTVMRRIQEGEHRLYAKNLLNTLAEMYGLSRTVLAGHCGGAVTAIYAAAEKRCVGLSGLLVYEPDFRIQTSSQEEVARKAAAYQGLRVAVLKSWAGPAIHKTFVALKMFRRRDKHEFRGGPGAAGFATLPAEANRRLIAAWLSVVAEQLPVLVITAPVKKRQPEFDYVGYLTRANPPSVRHLAVPGTNHAFVEGQGEQRLIELTRLWMRETFPHLPSFSVRAYRSEQPSARNVFPG